MADVDVVIAVGMVMAVVVAVRSTWSPCGLSMLASITPLAERGRGHRYRSTAIWFVTGSTVGGASLGSVMALGAVAVRAIAPGPRAVGGIVVVVAVAAAVSDGSVAGFRIPFHRRQVNERWLDGYRPWVYGAGFGWQIGSGLATYIVTAGVYLLVVLGVVTGTPWAALGLGTIFGLVRGLAVLLGRSVTTPESLQRLHRRLARLDPVSAAATMAGEATTALVAALWIATDAVGGRWASAWSAPWAVPAVVALLVVVVATAVVGVAASHDIPVAVGSRLRRQPGGRQRLIASAPEPARPGALRAKG